MKPSPASKIGIDLLNKSIRVKATQRAQSSVEYLIVVGLLSMALVIGPNSALEQLFRAFSDRYQSFTYAMSRP